MITVKLEHDRFDKKLRAIERNLDRAAKEGAEMVAAQIRHLMESSPATGAVYHRPWGTHQASAPGEPPAIDYGDLVNSIYTEKVAPGLYVAGLADPKAAWLEWGTPKMAARPSVRPAVAMVRKEFTELIRMAVQEGAYE